MHTVGILIVSTRAVASRDRGIWVSGEGSGSSGHNLSHVYVVCIRVPVHITYLHDPMDESARREESTDAVHSAFGSSGPAKSVSVGQHHHSALKEARVLSELTATVHTLKSISEVMDDILDLTDPSPGPERGREKRAGESIAVKQARLLDELKKWGS